MSRACCGGIKGVRGGINGSSLISDPGSRPVVPFDERYIPYIPAGLNEFVHDRKENRFLQLQ
jgi:hypothetical protein